jgi:hypothetical protein
MKKLTIKKSVFGILLLVLISSCSQNSVFKSPALKVQGKWRYKSVQFRPFGSFVNKDITDQFSNQTVEFNSDNSLSKVTLSDTLLGTWNIQQNLDNESNGSQNLVTAITNSNGTVSLSTLTNLYIGSRKIKGYEYRGDGMYTYVMEKL